MATRSAIASGVQILAGNPPADVLPLETIFEAIEIVETGMLNESELTENNRFLTKVDINAGTQDGTVATLPQGGTVPVHIQLLDSDTDGRRHSDVAIVERTDLEDAGRRGRLAVAFYDTPLRIAYSWQTSNERLRLWYDRSPDSDTQTAASLLQSPTLAPQYHNALKLRAAVLCRDLAGLPQMAALVGEAMRAEKQYSAYIDRRRGQRTGTKRPFTMRRGSYHGVRIGYDGLPRA